MTSLLAIAAGGAAGALLRYFVSGAGYRLLGEDFPWGTMVVNLTGCFFIGFLWVVFDRTILSSAARNFTLVGLLGAFTTFSTFGFETTQLLQAGEYKLALYNLLLSNFLGIVFVLFGLILARKIYQIVH